MHLKQTAAAKQYLRVSSVAISGAAAATRYSKMNKSAEGV